MNEHVTEVDAEEFSDGIRALPAAYCAATEAAEPQSSFNAMIDTAI